MSTKRELILAKHREVARRRRVAFYSGRDTAGRELWRWLLTHIK